MTGLEILGVLIVTDTVFNYVDKKWLNPKKKESKTIKKEDKKNN